MQKRNPNLKEIKRIIDTLQHAQKVLDHVNIHIKKEIQKESRMVLVRENKKYIYLAKGFIGYSLLIFTIVLLCGMVYGFINSPAQFRKGIYPEISGMYGEFKSKYASTNERMDEIKIDLCGVNPQYMKKECQDLVYARHAKEINSVSQ